MLPYSFDVNAPTTIPYLIIAGVILLIIGGSLLWRNRLLSAGQRVGTSAVARNPAGLVIVGALATLAALDVALIPDGSPNTPGYAPQAIGIIALLITALGMLYYLVLALAVWVADGQSLTYHALVFRHVTFRWDEVDWVYPQRKTTQYRYYGFIPAGKAVEENLVVEAGPKRQIAIPLDKKGTTNRMRASEAILAAVEQHATQALVGYDKQPFVLQKRQQFSTPVPR